MKGLLKKRILMYRSIKDKILIQTAGRRPGYKYRASLIQY